jgi:diacylglycerol kinase family enzyme
VTKDDLDDCLCHGADVVVAAGGDGTVGRVARRLAGTGVPMAVVPMGTANNVARSLGIEVDYRAAVLGLAHPAERRMDLGVVHDGNTRAYFLESFGLGVFAHVLAAKATRKDKKLERAAGLLAEELDQYVARHLRLEVEGRDCSGFYLVAAVMNGSSLGPALTIAPHAACDDGLLDVVLVPPEAKDELRSHLSRASAGGRVGAPVLATAFERVTAQSVRVRGQGGWAHLDDRPLRVNGGDLRVDIAPAALHLVGPPARVATGRRNGSLSRPASRPGAARHSSHGPHSPHSPHRT